MGGILLSCVERDQEVARRRGRPPYNAYMVYMVLEYFKNQDAVPIYRRFRDRGRMLPDGLEYVSSWVDLKMERCFQVMETEDRSLLDLWISKWDDLVDFEVVPVMTSKAMVEKIAPRL